MKTLSIALKTITVGLTLVGSISFAADEALAEKFVNKSELMKTLRAAGLPDGVQTGLTSDGKKCELTISTEAGKENVALQSESDEYPQRLLFDDELSDILFRVREAKGSISINQDLMDSFQNVKLEKVSDKEARATFTENIAGDERVLSCTFSNQ